MIVKNILNQNSTLSWVSNSQMKQVNLKGMCSSNNQVSISLFQNNDDSPYGGHLCQPVDNVPVSGVCCMVNILRLLAHKTY